MLRKNLTIAGIIALATIIVIAFLYVRKGQRFEENDPVSAIPVNAAIILQINNPEKLGGSLSPNTTFTSDLIHFESYRTIRKIATFLDSALILKNNPINRFNKRPITLSLHVDEEDKNWIASCAIKTRAEANEINRFINSLSTSSDQIKREGVTITLIKDNNQIPIPVYVLAYRGILSISNSESLLSASVIQRKRNNSLLDDASFKKIHKTSFTSNTTSVYINFKHLQEYASDLFSAPFLSSVSDWTELDLDIRNDGVYLNGFTFGTGDSLFTKLFDGISPQKNEISGVLPASTKFMMSYSLHTKERFKDNLVGLINRSDRKESYSQQSAAFKRKHIAEFADIFFSFIDRECALIYTEPDNRNPQNNKLLVFFTSGQSAALQVLQEMMTKNGKSTQPHGWTELDNQTRFPVYEMPEPLMMQQLWGFLFPEVPARYFAFYRNYLVFANSAETIGSFMYANILNKTLSAHPYFAPFTENFSYQENFFLFAEIPFIFSLSNKHLNRTHFNPTNEQNKALANFYGIGVQMSAAGDLTYTTLHANHAPHRDKEPRTIWQSRLDSAIIGKPALVDNHISGEKEILVQDALNNLYLINNMGRVLWKRSLDGPIISEISQIDYYRNNKLQYLFNTADRIYLLDRNGNHVARYPLALPAKATNGLAVFDYENNKDYRIFLALADKRIYLFDKTGNRNPGWSLPQTEGVVSTPVQYFHNQGRDYIVFSDQFRNYILDRRGETRVVPSVHFTRNPFSLFFLEGENSDRAALVTSTINGELAKIALPSGNTTLTKIIDSPGEHQFTLLPAISTTPKYLYITRNNLAIYNSAGKETINVTFDQPIHPHVDLYRFSASDIKFGVVEKTGGQIHLLNRDGSTYKGFPLKGISRFSIGFLKSSAYRFNLITGGEFNYLYNYRIE